MITLINPITEPICQSTCPGMPPPHDGATTAASPRSITETLDALPDRVVIYLVTGGIAIASNLVGETLFTIGYLISRGAGRVS